MAVDGFSIKNVGLGQEQTSAQMAINNERAVLLGQGAKSVENIANAGGNKAITLDDEKEKEKQSKKRQSKNNNDEQNEIIADTENEEAFKIETEIPKRRNLDFYTKFADKLGIRLNRKTEIIELYDKDTKKTVESITAVELTKLIDRLNISSGILVNRKI